MRHEMSLRGPLFDDAVKMFDANCVQSWKRSKSRD